MSRHIPDLTCNETMPAEDEKPTPPPRRFQVASTSQPQPGFRVGYLTTTPQQKNYIARPVARSYTVANPPIGRAVAPGAVGIAQPPVSSRGAFVAPNTATRVVRQGQMSDQHHEIPQHGSVHFTTHSTQPVPIVRHPMDNRMDTYGVRTNQPTSLQNPFVNSMRLTQAPPAQSSSSKTAQGLLNVVQQLPRHTPSPNINTFSTNLFARSTYSPTTLSTTPATSASRIVGSQPIIPHPKYSAQNNGSNSSRIVAPSPTPGVVRFQTTTPASVISQSASLAAIQRANLSTNILAHQLSQQQAQVQGSSTSSFAHPSPSLMGIEQPQVHTPSPRSTPLILRKPGGQGSAAKRKLPLTDIAGASTAGPSASPSISSVRSIIQNANEASTSVAKALSSVAAPIGGNGAEGESPRKRQRKQQFDNSKHEPMMISVGVEPIKTPIWDLPRDHPLAQEYFRNMQAIPPEKKKRGRPRADANRSDQFMVQTGVRRVFVPMDQVPNQALSQIAAQQNQLINPGMSAAAIAAAIQGATLSTLQNPTTSRVLSGADLQHINPQQTVKEALMKHAAAQAKAALEKKEAEKVAEARRAAEAAAIAAAAANAAAIQAAVAQKMAAVSSSKTRTPTHPPLEKKQSVDTPVTSRAQEKTLAAQTAAKAEPKETVKKILTVAQKKAAKNAKKVAPPPVETAEEKSRKLKAAKAEQKAAAKEAAKVAAIKLKRKLLLRKKKRKLRMKAKKDAEQKKKKEVAKASAPLSIEQQQKKVIFLLSKMYSRNLKKSRILNKYDQLKELGFFKKYFPDKYREVDETPKPPMSQYTASGRMRLTFDQSTTSRWNHFDNIESLKDAVEHKKQAKKILKAVKKIRQKLRKRCQKVATKQVNKADRRLRYVFPQVKYRKSLTDKGRRRMIAHLTKIMMDRIENFLRKMYPDVKKQTEEKKKKMEKKEKQENKIKKIMRRMLRKKCREMKIENEKLEELKKIAAETKPKLQVVNKKYILTTVKEARIVKGKAMLVDIVSKQLIKKNVNVQALQKIIITKKKKISMKKTMASLLKNLSKTANEAKELSKKPAASEKKKKLTVEAKKAKKAKRTKSSKQTMPVRILQSGSKLEKEKKKKDKKQKEGKAEAVKLQTTENLPSLSQIAQNQPSLTPSEQALLQAQASSIPTTQTITSVTQASNIPLEKLLVGTEAVRTEERAGFQPPDIRGLSISNQAYAGLPSTNLTSTYTSGLVVSSSLPGSTLAGLPGYAGTPFFGLPSTSLPTIPAANLPNLLGSSLSFSGPSAMPWAAPTISALCGPTITAVAGSSMSALAGPSTPAISGNTYGGFRPPTSYSALTATTLAVQNFQNTGMLNVHDLGSSAVPEQSSSASTVPAISEEKTSPPEELSKETSKEAPKSNDSDEFGPSGKQGKMGALIFVAQAYLTSNPDASLINRREQIEGYQVKRLKKKAKYVRMMKKKIEEAKRLAKENRPSFEDNTIVMASSKEELSNKFLTAVEKGACCYKVEFVSEKKKKKMEEKKKLEELNKKTEEENEKKEAASVKTTTSKEAAAKMKALDDAKFKRPYLPMDRAGVSASDKRTTKEAEKKSGASDINVEETVAKKNKVVQESKALQERKAKIAAAVAKFNETLQAKKDNGEFKKKIRIRPPSKSSTNSRASAAKRRKNMTATFKQNVQRALTLCYQRRQHRYKTSHQLKKLWNLYMKGKQLKVSVRNLKMLRRKILKLRKIKQIGLIRKAAKKILQDKETKRAIKQGNGKIWVLRRARMLRRKRNNKIRSLKTKYQAIFLNNIKSKSEKQKMLARRALKSVTKKSDLISSITLYKKLTKRLEQTKAQNANERLAAKTKKKYKKTAILKGKKKQNKKNESTDKEGPKRRMKLKEVKTSSSQKSLPKPKAKAMMVQTPARVTPAPTSILPKLPSPAEMAKIMPISSPIKRSTNNFPPLLPKKQQMPVVQVREEIVKPKRILHQSDKSVVEQVVDELVGFVAFKLDKNTKERDELMRRSMLRHNLQTYLWLNKPKQQTDEPAKISLKRHMKNINALNQKTHINSYLPSTSTVEPENTVLHHSFLEVFNERIRKERNIPKLEKKLAKYREIDMKNCQEILENSVFEVKYDNKKKKPKRTSSVKSVSKVERELQKSTVKKNKLSPVKATAAKPSSVKACTLKAFAAKESVLKSSSVKSSSVKPSPGKLLPKKTAPIKVITQTKTPEVTKTPVKAVRRSSRTPVPSAIRRESLMLAEAKAKEKAKAVAKVVTHHASSVDGKPKEYERVSAKEVVEMQPKEQANVAKEPIVIKKEKQLSSAGFSTELPFSPKKVKPSSMQSRRTSRSTSSSSRQAVTTPKNKVALLPQKNSKPIKSAVKSTPKENDKSTAAVKRTPEERKEKEKLKEESKKTTPSTGPVKEQKKVKKLITVASRSEIPNPFSMLCNLRPMRDLSDMREVIDSRQKDQIEEDRMLYEKRTGPVAVPLRPKNEYLKLQSKLKGVTPAQNKQTLMKRRLRILRRQQACSDSAQQSIKLVTEEFDGVCALTEREKEVALNFGTTNMVITDYRPWKVIKAQCQVGKEKHNCESRYPWSALFTKKWDPVKKAFGLPVKRKKIYCRKKRREDKMAKALLLDPLLSDWKKKLRTKKAEKRKLNKIKTSKVKSKKSILKKSQQKKKISKSKKEELKKTKAKITSKKERARQVKDDSKKQFAKSMEVDEVLVKNAGKKEVSKKEKSEKAGSNKIEAKKDTSKKTFKKEKKLEKAKDNSKKGAKLVYIVQKIKETGKKTDKVEPKVAVEPEKREKLVLTYDVVKNKLQSMDPLKLKDFVTKLLSQMLEKTKFFRRNKTVLRKMKPNKLHPGLIHWLKKQRRDALLAKKKAEIKKKREIEKEKQRCLKMEALKKEKDEKAKAEAAGRVKAQAEAQAKVVAEIKAKSQAEVEARARAEALAQAEAEVQARAEALALAAAQEEAARAAEEAAAQVESDDPPKKKKGRPLKMKTKIAMKKAAEEQKKKEEEERKRVEEERLRIEEERRREEEERCRIEMERLRLKEEIRRMEEEREEEKRRQEEEKRKAIELEEARKPKFNYKEFKQKLCANEIPYTFADVFNELNYIEELKAKRLAQAERKAAKVATRADVAKAVARSAAAQKSPQKVLKKQEPLKVGIKKQLAKPATKKEGATATLSAKPGQTKKVQVAAKGAVKTVQAMGLPKEQGKTVAKGQVRKMIKTVVKLQPKGKEKEAQEKKIVKVPIKSAVKKVMKKVLQPKGIAEGTSKMSVDAKGIAKAQAVGGSKFAAKAIIASNKTSGKVLVKKAAITKDETMVPIKEGINVAVKSATKVPAKENMKVAVKISAKRTTKLPVKTIPKSQVKKIVKQPTKEQLSTSVLEQTKDNTVFKKPEIKKTVVTGQKLAKKVKTVAEITQPKQDQGTIKQPGVKGIAKIKSKDTLKAQIKKGSVKTQAKKEVRVASKKKVKEADKVQVNVAIIDVPEETVVTQEATAKKTTTATEKQVEKTKEEEPTEVIQVRKEMNRMRRTRKFVLRNGKVIFISLRMKRLFDQILLKKKGSKYISKNRLKKIQLLKKKKAGKKKRAEEKLNVKKLAKEAKKLEKKKGTKESENEKGKKKEVSKKKMVKKKLKEKNDKNLENTKDGKKLEKKSEKIKDGQKKKDVKKIKAKEDDKEIKRKKAEIKETLEKKKKKKLKLKRLQKGAKKEELPKKKEKEAKNTIDKKKAKQLKKLTNPSKDKAKELRKKQKMGKNASKKSVTEEEKQIADKKAKSEARLKQMKIINNKMLKKLAFRKAVTPGLRKQMKKYAKLLARPIRVKNKLRPKRVKVVQAPARRYVTTKSGFTIVMYKGKETSIKKYRKRLRNHQRKQRLERRYKRWKIKELKKSKKYAKEARASKVTYKKFLKIFKRINRIEDYIDYKQDVLHKAISKPIRNVFKASLKARKKLLHKLDKKLKKQRQKRREKKKKENEVFKKRVEELAKEKNITECQAKRLLKKKIVLPYRQQTPYDKAVLELKDYFNKTMDQLAFDRKLLSLFLDYLKANDPEGYNNLQLDIARDFEPGDSQEMLELKKWQRVRVTLIEPPIFLPKAVRIPYIEFNEKLDLNPSREIVNKAMKDRSPFWKGPKIAKNKHNLRVMKNGAVTADRTAEWKPLDLYPKEVYLYEIQHWAQQEVFENAQGAVEEMWEIYLKNQGPDAPMFTADKNKPLVPEEKQTTRGVSRRCRAKLKETDDVVYVGEVGRPAIDLIDTSDTAMNDPETREQWISCRETLANSYKNTYDTSVMMMNTLYTLYEHLIPENEEKRAAEARARWEQQEKLRLEMEARNNKKKKPLPRKKKQAAKPKKKPAAPTRRRAPPVRGKGKKAGKATAVKKPPAKKAPAKPRAPPKYPPRNRTPIQSDIMYERNLRRAIQESLKTCMPSTSKT